MGIRFTQVIKSLWNCLQVLKSETLIVDAQALHTDINSALKNS